jgi:non-ribosomal peptide synthetase component F
LLRVADAESVLLLTVHHISGDGWSTTLLVEELSALYRAFRAGSPSPLRALPIQYADFAHWQRLWLTGARLEEQLAYWRAQLAGAAPALELPTDRQRPATPSQRGDRERLVLDAGLSAKLKALSREQGATLYMTLLAAFKVLLYRWTGQEDILVGTPVAGRTRRETEDLIGFFVNTLVLRTRVSGELSFRELVGQVRETTLGAFTHQEVPFEKLVEELQPERDLSRTPFFQVMFILQNASKATPNLPGLQLDLLDVHSATEKFDLTLSMQETGESFCAVLHYNTDLFDAPTIERFAAHFKNLLSAIVADPAQSLSHLPMLTGEEEDLLLVEWNGTTSEYPREKSLHHLFAEQARRTPDAIAVVYGDEQVTYAELEGRANRLARHLRSLSVGAETRVGLYLSRTTKLVTALLGILKASASPSCSPTPGRRWSSPSRRWPAHCRRPGRRSCASTPTTN